MDSFSQMADVSGLRYEDDYTMGHRVYWREILNSVREEIKNEENISGESQSEVDQFGDGRDGQDS